jgi:tetratricopeptide (TPR) repeat protein
MQPCADLASATAAQADFDDERAAIVAARMRRRGALDVVLAVLVLLFAAVLGSTTIRDSGIWSRLATGRQLVTAEPDASPGPQWPAHAAVERMAPGWLFDVGCYLVHRVAGDLGLGIAKTVFVILLAAALMWAGWSRGSGWFAAGATGLALLAMAPRLELQPGLVSLWFLAMTIGYLERRRVAQPSGRTRSWVALTPLFGLFIVWVNTDAWFLLGPAVLACYAITGRRPGSANVPIGAVTIGFVVCLANPQLAGAFRPPAELALRWHGAALADDAIYRTFLVSPLTRQYHTAGWLWNPPRLALALLALVGLFAMVLNRAGRDGARLLVCAGLLGLGLYQARLLPGLAVGLGALIPRGLAAFATAHHVDGAVGELRLRQAVTARAGMVAAGLAFLVVAALGRLPGPALLPRGWGLATDPSLIAAAEALAAWRQDATLPPPSRGFCYAPDAADYLAWYCPQEGSAADSRRWLLADVAHDIVTVRQGLTGAAPAASRRRGWSGGADWRAVLRGAGVDHVVFADLDGQRVQAVLHHMVTAPAEWTVLLQVGRVLVLRWHDPARPMPALTAALDGVRPHAPTQAPSSPPSPVEPAWWDPLLPHVVAPSIDRDEAELRLMRFNALRRPTALARDREWLLAVVTGATAQAAVGDVAGAALRLELLADTAWSRQLAMGYRTHADEAPVEHLWAAVRACRRAVAGDPRDGDAYLLLGDAYCQLCWSSAERAWDTRMPLLRQLRRQQAVAALHRAVELKPDSIAGHARLVALYQQMGAVDFALRHVQTLQQIQRAQGPQPGEPAARFTERVDGTEREVQRLQRELAARTRQFASQPVGPDLVTRAHHAARLGMADHAVDLLLGATGSALGPDGLRLELELLLLAGRVDDGRAWLEPSHRALLGDLDYHRLAAQLAAAAGDYAEADVHLRELVVRSAVIPEFGARPVDLDKAIAVTVASQVLAGLRQCTAPQPLLVMLYGGLEPRLHLERLVRTSGQSAHFALLRGSVALELGDVEQAARHIRVALELSGDGGVASDTSVHPIAAYYRRLLAAR